MRTESWLLCVIVVTCAGLGSGYLQAEPMTVPRYTLRLNGTASGGLLVLARARIANPAYVAIETVPDESAESVARRLADKINEGDPFGWNVGLIKGDPVGVSSSGPSVRGLAAGVYTLGGTETGLGMPKPPLYLSCSYDKSNDKVVLRWVNPPGGYDYIFVNLFWNRYYHANTIRLSGTATSLTIDLKKKPLNVNDMAFHVIGFRDRIPSNAASIHVSENGRCQSELYGIPFTARVAPNWVGWSSTGQPDASAFEQGKKYERYGGHVMALSGKPFYQAIKAPPAGSVHGIWRKFLGLTPGHTYRLTAHLSTLEMDSAKGDWSLSVHAAANPPDGNDLTVQQLAGLAALADGSKGPKAGRIALYDARNTTRRMWETTLTGYKPFLRPAAGPHITLPADANTLTVWVRFSCSHPNGQIGFSGVRLEDITALGDKLKTGEQVIEQERQEQARVQEREAWFKEKAAKQRAQDKKGQ